MGEKFCMAAALLKVSLFSVEQSDRLVDLMFKSITILFAYIPVRYK